MSDGGNVKIATVMGDAAMNRLSDRGSIPLSSTKKALSDNNLLFDNAFSIDFTGKTHINDTVS